MSRTEYLHILGYYMAVLRNKGMDGSELLQQWLNVFDEKEVLNQDAP